jgi:hypothetical protein
LPEDGEAIVKGGSAPVAPAGGLPFKK